MQLRKGLLGVVVGLSTVVLAACSQDAPNLSFEETIKAYGEQNQSMLSALELLTATDGIVSTKLDGSVSVESDSQESGKAVISSKSISDAKTHDQESDLNFNFDIHSQEALLGTAVNATAKLGLKAIVKDYIPYIQLTELDINAQEKDFQSQMGFLTGMAGGLKDKWLTISGFDLKDLLSQVSNQSLLFTGKIMQDKIEYYTGVQSVKYEGQPAWKVGLNIDLVKEDAKKLLRESLMSGNNLSGDSLSGDSLFIFQDQQANLAQMEAVIDSMSFQNLEAYFVIYAQDNIKFVIKNADLIIPDQLRVIIKQSVKKDQYEGEFNVEPILTGEELSGAISTENITVNYLIKGTSKSKFSFDVKVLQGQEQQLQLAGTLAFVLGEDAFSIKPDFNLVIDTIKIGLQGSYAVEKIDNYTFVAPEKTEDLGALFGGMFGMGSADEVAQYEEDLADLASEESGVITVTGAKK